MVFMHNPSARKALDARLRLSEQLLEKNPAGVMVTTVDGTIVTFNAAAEQLFRYSVSSRARH